MQNNIQLLFKLYDDIFIVDKIVDDLEGYLKTHPAIAKNTEESTQTGPLSSYVRMVSYSDSALDIEVYAFTTTRAFYDFKKVHHDILLHIGKCVSKHGGTMAFQTITLEQK